MKIGTDSKIYKEFTVRFSFTKKDEYTTFLQKAKFGYNPELYIELPLYVSYGNIFDKQFVFKTSFKFYTEITKERLIEIKKDWERDSVVEWFNKYMPESTLLDELTETALKWVSKDIIEPTPIVSNYVCGTEFIEVDEETDFGGNFTQNGKEGCHLDFGENETDYELTDFSLPIYVSWYSLPYNKEHLTTDREFSDFNNQEKFDFIKNLGIETFLTVFEKELRYYKEEFQGMYYPYEVRLSGNDDCSYTKYFLTEQEMLNEVYRLRRCQPINIELDIYGNGYVFTN